MPAIEKHTIEEQSRLPQGLEIAWYAQRRLCVLKITQNHRLAIDEWEQALTRCFADWPSQQMVLILLDFNGIGLTPYLRERSIEMMQTLNPSQPERLALVFSKDFMGLVIKTFAQWLVRFINNKNSQFRVFEEREQALAWLMGFVPPSV